MQKKLEKPYRQTPASKPVVISLLFLGMALLFCQLAEAQPAAEKVIVPVCEMFSTGDYIQKLKPQWEYTLPAAHGNIMEIINIYEENLILLSKKLILKEISDELDITEINDEAESISKNHTRWIQAFNIRKRKITWSFRCQGDEGTFVKLCKNRLIMNGYAGTLKAINPRTGKVTWNKKVFQDKSSHFYFDGKNLLIIDGLSIRGLNVHFGTLNWETRIKTKHKKAWKDNAGRESFLSEVISFGGKVYFGNKLGEVFCFKTEDGSLFWKTKIQPPANGPIQVDRQQLYLGTNQGEIFFIARETGRINKIIQIEKGNIIGLLAKAGNLYGFSGENDIFSFASGTYEVNWMVGTPFIGCRKAKGLTLIQGILWKPPTSIGSFALAGFDKDNGMPAYEILSSASKPGFLPRVSYTLPIAWKNLMLIGDENKVLAYKLSLLDN